MSSVKVRDTGLDTVDADTDACWIAVVPPVQGAARASAAGVILSIARLRDRRAAGQDREVRIDSVGADTYGSGDRELADDIADEIARTGWE